MRKPLMQGTPPIRSELTVMRVNLMLALLACLTVDLDTSISNVDSMGDSADGIRPARLPLWLTTALVFGATPDSNSTEVIRKCLLCLGLL